MQNLLKSITWGFSMENKTEEQSKDSNQVIDSNPDIVPHEKRGESLSSFTIIAIVIIAVVLLINQFQIQTVSTYTGVKTFKAPSFKTFNFGSSGSKDLDTVDFSQIKSTGQGGVISVGY